MEASITVYIQGCTKNTRLTHLKCELYEMVSDALNPKRIATAPNFVTIFSAFCNIPMSINVQWPLFTVNIILPTVINGRSR